ncbi:PAS domain S-box protein [Azohydromonas lata]|uniref:PAS domain S-box protein n=1 Tax=Azohydromonas lata TaxID=45677 RepID=A0ABU5IL91_9BURK|nr:PAS domain S-box protein [Azohydromonas lata]MDZ5459652.1 PAS domain S-box protein [Azohydromonas lata]
MRHADVGLQRSMLWAGVVRRLFEGALGLLPALAIAYVYAFQDPALRLESHLFHQVAIAVATLEGIFISYVAWRCYLRSGEVMLRWVTLAFSGFTIVYSLHGFFTPLAHHNLWLFILYGPASRLVAGWCLLMALLRFNSPPDAAARRADAGYWLRWVGGFLAVNVAVGVLAHSPLAGAPWVRMSMELGSIALYVVALGLQAVRGLRSPLMKYAALAFVWFAFSSASFLLAKPWNHQWWLAHGIFAVGFSVLGYGILRVFLAARSFEHAFSVEELTEDLAQTNGRLREAMERLEQVNRAQGAQMRALEVSRAQFEAFFDLSPDGIFVVDGKGLVLKANSRAEGLFGYGAGDLAGIQVEELIPVEMRLHHQRARSLHQYSPQTRAMGTESRTQTCLRRDGSTFSATISLSSLIYEGRQCTVTFVRDVTRLLLRYEEIRQEDRASIRQGHVLEQLSAQLPFVLFQFRRAPDGRYDFPYMSPKVTDMLGCEADALRANINLWFSCVDPAALAPLITSIERSAAERSPWTAQWQMLRPHGEAPLPCVLSCSAPVQQTDGSLVWTGYMRRAQERQTDAAPGGVGLAAQASEPMV